MLISLLDNNTVSKETPSILLLVASLSKALSTFIHFYPNNRTKSSRSAEVCKNLDKALHKIPSVTFYFHIKITKIQFAESISLCRDNAWLRRYFFFLYLLLSRVKVDLQPIKLEKICLILGYAVFTNVQVSRILCL